MSRDAARPPAIRAAFAVAAPGLESLVAAELAGLGITEAEVAEGGVLFDSSLRRLYEANLQLRTASRVLVRLAGFRAVSFAELERGARKVPWELAIGPNDRVLLRVTCRKSRLYHSAAVAERLTRDIAQRIGARATTAAREEVEDDPGAAQLIVVRIDRNRCTVSADSSGDHLHRRGYRTAVTQAPLRETLAAAMVIASGWDRKSPLLDPFCGSGTIPVEAALLAAMIAPGIDRRFRFQQWPGFDESLWTTVVEAARQRERRDRVPAIMGSDRSAAAIRAALANAERASVGSLVEFMRADAAQLDLPSLDTGWIVSNPPYGVRLGDRDEARRALAMLDDALRRRSGAWRMALLVPAVSKVDRALVEAFRTTNGGLAVRLVRSAD